jgi:5-methylcytosine-specific restriction protein A
MQFKGGNRSIRDHAADGRALYLFKSHGKGKRHQYMGEFVLANHSVRRGPDRDGADRDVIVFHLLRVSEKQDDPGLGTQGMAGAKTIDEARNAAITACTAQAGAAGKIAVQTLYERSETVRAYVLLRAKGVCECCSSDSPFERSDGSAYLEVHHTTRLSDGGLDHPKHTAAVCPNCHREIHCGRDGTVKNLALRAKLELNW